MNHNEVHSYMADYLEGGLDLTKGALLDAHLDGCEDCRQEFAEMRQTISLLRGLPSPEPPPFFVENVMRRIRDGEGQLRFTERLREWVSSIATPQIALPATALGLGLLMATGVVDPNLLSLSGDSRVEPERVVRQVPPPQLPLSVTTRRPAVAGAPRVTITLPSAGAVPTVSQVASNEPTPFYTRRAPRSIRGAVPPLLGSSPGLATPVVNRLSPQMSAAHGSAFETDGDSTGLSQEERRARELDQRLDRMVRTPAAFAAEFAAYSVAEQEIWLVALAERARETGRGQEALAELRLAGDRSAIQLATALSVELQRVGATASTSTSVSEEAR